MKKGAKDSAVWAAVKPCVRSFQRGKCQTRQPRLNAGFRGDLGNCSCKQEKGRWVASASGFEIVGCYPRLPRYLGALTGVAAGIQELRRKTMKKRGAKGRI